PIHYRSLHSFPTRRSSDLATIRTPPLNSTAWQASPFRNTVQLGLLTSFAVCFELAEGANTYPEESSPVVSCCIWGRNTFSSTRSDIPAALMEVQLLSIFFK